MNRTIKVFRTTDPLFDIRVEIYGSPHGTTGAPVECLSLTSQEALQLEQVFSMLRYNLDLAAITTRAPKGGAS